MEDKYWFLSFRRDDFGKGSKTSEGLPSDESNTHVDLIERLFFFLEHLGYIGGGFYGSKERAAECIAEPHSKECCQAANNKEEVDEADLPKAEKWLKDRGCTILANEIRVYSDDE